MGVFFCIVLFKTQVKNKRLIYKLFNNMLYRNCWLILILSFCSCTNSLKTKPNPPKIEYNSLTPTVKQNQRGNISTSWEILVFKKGGCLVGQQYRVGSLQKMKEPHVYNQLAWLQFIKHDKSELTSFLVTQLADTTKTKIHVCPFFSATNAEMAIYALQQIHNKNWYDLTAFNHYKNKPTTSALNQPQIWLQNILTNPTKRAKLAAFYNQ